MLTSMKWVALAFVAACSFDEAEPDPGIDTAAQSINTVTTIQVSGRFAFVLLNEGDETNGSLTASKDQLTNTSGLDFGYVEPHPSDPDILVFIQGAGPIPNNTFSINGQAAELHVTTTFPITRCEVNDITGEIIVCGAGAPVRFDLGWANDHFGETHEKTKRREEFGPVTTRFEGEFKSRSALINGTWTGHTGVDLGGNLLQTVSTTITREITVNTGP